MVTCFVLMNDIMFDGNKLKSVLEFTFLGSTISSNGCIDDEIQRRMGMASASFGRLRQRLWNNHHVSMRVKSNIYRAIMLSTLLYGAEAWTAYRRQVKKLHAFMMRYLRSIMRITWMDKVTHKDIFERTRLPSMEDLLTRKNLRWTGHFMKMSPDGLPKQVLCLLVFWSQKERAPSVQGYHQEKPEAERHKVRLMDITLTAER